MTSGPNYSMASLYVGDLSPDLTEAMLFEKFSAIGPVLSIRVCRDLMTGRSLGYAYVNFQEVSDAEKAIETMNFEVLKDRPVRIMWSQRDPSLRKSGVGNVFIKNLDKSIDNSVMYDTFSTFGTILSCKVAQDSHGLSRGYGFVHFSTEESASNAINKVNGMLLNGKKVFVGKFVPKAERDKSSVTERGRHFTNVYVKHLTDDYDDQALSQLFEPFGKILSAKVMIDEKTGKSRCFGFVAFEESTSAQNCVQELNGKKEMANGKHLYVSRAQKKAERREELRRRFEELRQKRINRYKGINLYVKNLDEAIDEQRLRNEFSAFGTITSVKVMADQSSGRSRGFGFVCFTTADEAQKAINEMNNRIVATKPLYVALAQTRDERKAFLNTQFQQQNNTVMRTQPMATPGPHHPSQLVPHPQFITAVNPAAAAMAYAANSAMAMNGFRGHPMPAQGPHSWNDIRRNRRLKFY